jgi:RNA-directed DNA polymerase
MSQNRDLEWYLSKDGKSYGPFSSTGVIKLLDAAQISYLDYVWHKDLANWIQIKDVNTFAFPKEEDPGIKLEHELEREYEKRASFSASRESPTAVFEVKPLAEWIGISNAKLTELSEKANELYSPFPIEGKKKKRWIEAPNEELKTLQRSILDKLLQNISLCGAAHGFVANRSILTHASGHRRKRWVVTLDIRSFFPSVTGEMVRVIAKSLPIPQSDVETFVKLTTRNNHLPQGAPTSPNLGNLVLKDLDHKLCKQVKGTGWFYSRYADDLTFSGFKNPKSMLLKARALIEEAGFSVSVEKCRIRGKDQRQMVTGIVVNDKLALSKQKRNMVRAMKHRLQQGLVPSEELPHVMGWINFSNYIDRSNHFLKRKGPSARPRRLSIKKRFEVYKKMADAIMAGDYQGMQNSSLASESGVSVSSVRRLLDPPLSVDRIKKASISELSKVDLFLDIGFFGYALHDLAEAGRLFDLELNQCKVSDLLRIRILPDSKGLEKAQTVLGAAISSGVEIDWSHPLLKDKEQLIQSSELIEKVAGLVLQGEKQYAVDLALGTNSKEVITALLSFHGDEFSFPNWIYCLPYVDYRSFFFNLLGKLGLHTIEGFENPLKHCESLNFSDDESLVNLDFLWDCKNLKELNLKNCSSLEDINGLRHCPNIVTLNLDGCNALSQFDAVSNLTSLVNLSINVNHISSGSVDGVEACKKAWCVLAKNEEDEFDEYQFAYTGTIASGEPYLLFSEDEFQVSEEELAQLEEEGEGVYEEDWFKPIRELLEDKCEKWGPSLCVKINGRWAIMGYYSW